MIKSITKKWSKAMLIVIVMFYTNLSYSQVSHVVISQVYAGGGNASATYTNDFIELFNPTGSPIAIGGWSVQYASAAGTTWSVTSIPAGKTIAAGGYFLIKEVSGGATGAALPTSDVPTTGTINMAVAGGKVALVSNAVALAGGCPTGGAIVDFLGWGTANCFEGTSSAPAASSNTTAVIRRNSGCSDANQNNTEFTASAVVPHNSASSSPLSISLVSQTNVNCFAGSNGSAAVSVTGGSTTYSWAASGGSAATATGLSAGVYTCTAIVGQGGGSCTMTKTVTITQPSSALISSAVSQSNVSVFGGSDGAATVSAATGGTGGYSYDWTPGNPTGDGTVSVTGLTAGTWTCTVTDANSCVNTITFTITQPSVPASALNFDGVNDNIACGNGSSINNLAPAGFTMEAWINPSNLSGNSAYSIIRKPGDYNLFLIFGHLWAEIWTAGTGNSTWKQIQGSTAVSLNTWTHVAAVWDGTTCVLYQNGVIDPSTTSGGNIGVSASLFIGSNEVSSEFFNGSMDEVRIWNRALCQSEIQNNKNCEIATTGTGLVANYHFNQGNTGIDNSSIASLTDASGSGNTGTLNGFALNGATSNWTGPGAVTTGNSCGAFVPTSVTVTSVSQTNILCNGGSNGAASVSASGGSGFTYNWTPGNPTGDGTASVTGLTAGTWTCTVTNSCGGTGTQIFTITAPTTITASASQTNVSCNGGTDGSATIVATGGTPAYTYSWSPTGGTAATASGLSAGTYTCTITDANGCTTTQTVTITAPSALLVSAASQSNVSVFSGSDGAAAVSASGGTTSYSYDWAPGNPTGDGTASVTGLTAGTWTCTVTDANSCVNTATFTITQPAAALNFDGANDNVSVPVDSRLTNLGATGFTLESWLNTPNFNSDAASLIRKSGDYNFYVYQGKLYLEVWPVSGGATMYQFSGNVSVSQNTWTHVAAVWNGTTCALYVNGVAQTVNMTTLSVQVFENMFLGRSSIFGNPYVGSIDEVRVWNRALCQSEIQNNKDCEIASSANGLVVNYHFNQGFINGTNTGVTTLTDASGNGLHGTLNNFALSGSTSNWSGPGGVTSGVSCGAFTPSTVTVTTASSTNVSCNGGSNGAVSVTATGGSGFTYNWTPGNPAGDGTASVTGLTAGTWTCTVTNDCGGTGTYTITITQPAVLAASATSTNVSCNGGTDGSATVAATGGTPAYNYSWSPTGGTQATAGSLAAGTYTCTLTDANGCTTTQTVTITEPTAITASINAANVSCNGGSDGRAIVSASGGTPVYTYNWAPTGGNAAMASGLTAGTYTCHITDANGCTTTQTATITAPTAITSSATATNVSCNGGSNGSATVTATGGTPAYTYSWSPTGGTAATATGLNAGTYTCTITDANGCTKTQTATITAPAAITSSATTTNVSCNGGSNGSATVTATGGTPAYTYSWLPTGGTAATATGLNAGTYTCTITDANGCTKTQTVSITAPTALSVAISASPATICTGNSSTLTASTSGGTGSVTYSWNTGAITTAITVNPTTATTYTVTATDANGCTNTSIQTITVNQLPAVSASASPASITSGSSSALTATGAATYTWMPGNLSGASVNVSPTSTVTYTVSGTNASGCVNTNTVTVNVTAGGGAGATKLSTADCGITESAITQTLHCDAVSGATAYEYELTESGTGNVYTYARANYNDFQLTWVPQITYGATYSIRVHAKVGGVYGSYGTVCTVTTPSFPSTQLQPASCGITLSTITQVVNIVYVPNATNYEYELTESGTGNVYTWKRSNSNSDFSPSWVPQVTYAKTYSVRVRAYQGTTAGPYGSVCTLTTPAFPSTQLQASSCGVTLPSTSTVVNCVAVPDATNYQYEITEASLGTVTKLRGNFYTDFCMTWFYSAASLHSKTYSIRVKAYVGGVWGPYGSACTLTMPATGRIANPDLASTDINTEVSVNAYPNPTNGMLTIDASEKIMQISLYSLSGDLVIKDTPINQINLSNLPNAAYILVVRTESTVKHIRILKQE